MHSRSLGAMVAALLLPAAGCCVCRMAPAAGRTPRPAAEPGVSVPRRSQPSGEKVGEESFRSPGLPRFTQHATVGAAWRVAGGVLEVSGAGDQSVLIRDGSVVEDGWVEVRSDHADEGGLVLRFVDNDNYYLLAFRDDGSLLGFRNVEFFRRRAGHFQILTPGYGKDIPWPRGVERTVRFEAVENVLRVYVDGVLVDSVADPEPIMQPGAVGLRYHDVPEAPGSDFSRYRSLRWQAY
ncbi:MAG: hypothetical protein JWM27_1347 [Gemmatimonadetes bacterium]|nr:hypothetical protein [Gemmatimonadota bacterium]